MTEAPHRPFPDLVGPPRTDRQKADDGRATRSRPTGSRSTPFPRRPRREAITDGRRSRRPGYGRTGPDTVRPPRGRANGGPAWARSGPRHRTVVAGRARTADRPCPRKPLGGGRRTLGENVPVRERERPSPVCPGTRGQADVPSYTGGDRRGRNTARQAERRHECHHAAAGQPRRQAAVRAAPYGWSRPSRRSS